VAKARSKFSAKRESHRNIRPVVLLLLLLLLLRRVSVEFFEISHPPILAVGQMSLDCCATSLKFNCHSLRDSH
jgi:hypothetical protein